MFHTFSIKSWILAVTFLLYSSISLADEWHDIPGIPNPEFGITNEAPIRPENWNSDVLGFYYIDNKNSESTDDSTYGNPSKPRKTIPNPVPAGSVVEIHGLYDLDIIINSLGSATKPVYVRGISKDDPVIFSRKLDIKGNYLTIENFISKPIVAEAKHRIYISEGSDHITLRNGELSDAGSTGSNAYLEIGSWNYQGPDKASNILIYKMNIHDLGDRDANFDQDVHGINIHGRTENVWILYNTMSRVSGDGIQIEAQHSRGNDQIQKIYIGKNVTYDNKQSGIWIKHAKKVVISSNTIYGIYASDSSSGQCTGYQYSSEDFWFINNTIYNCAQGIMAAGGDTGSAEKGSVYYIGNQIYDINSHNPTNPHQAGGITLRMGETNHYVIGNTIDDTDVALSSPLISGKLFVYNNIFSHRNESNNTDIYVEAVADNSEIDNNIFYNASGVKIRWNQSYNNLQNFISGTSKCIHCIDKDPKFSNKEIRDYNLSIGSPAINAGHDIEQLVFTAFKNTFGFELSLDNKDFSVPVNEWDIGAFEFYENTTTKPLSPTDVNIKVESK